MAETEITVLVTRIRSHYANLHGFPPRLDRCFAEELKRWVVNHHTCVDSCSVQTPLEVLVDGRNEQSFALLLAAILLKAGFPTAVLWQQDSYCAGVALPPSDGDIIVKNLGTPYVVWVDGQLPEDSSDFEVCALSLAGCQQYDGFEWKCPQDHLVAPWQESCPTCGGAIVAC